MSKVESWEAASDRLVVEMPFLVSFYYADCVFGWCEEQFGKDAARISDGEDGFAISFDSNAAWTWIGDTLFFRNVEDAVLARLYVNHG